MQVEPLIEELATVAVMANLPINIMRYDVTATNPLPEDIASTFYCRVARTCTLAVC